MPSEPHSSAMEAFVQEGTGETEREERTNLAKEAILNFPKLKACLECTRCGRERPWNSLKLALDLKTQKAKIVRFELLPDPLGKWQHHEGSGTRGRELLCPQCVPSHEKDIAKEREKRAEAMRKLQERADAARQQQSQRNTTRPETGTESDNPSSSTAPG